MADEEVKEKKAEEGAEEKPKSSLPVVIGIIVGVLVLQAVLMFVFMGMTTPKDPEKEKAKAVADSLKQLETSKTTVGTILEESIEAVVNIAGTDGGRFLKINVVAEYDADRYPDLPLELLKRKAIFKNMLLEQTGAMSLEELKEADSKLQIRKEFKKKVNAILPPEAGEISNIYINEFIIQ